MSLTEHIDNERVPVPTFGNRRSALHVVPPSLYPDSGPLPEYINPDAPPHRRTPRGAVRKEAAKRQAERNAKRQAAYAETRLSRDEVRAHLMEEAERGVYYDEFGSLTRVWWLADPSLYCPK